MLFSVPAACFAAFSLLETLLTNTSAVLPRNMPLVQTMTDTTTATAKAIRPSMPRPFKVARVEKTDAPDGGQGQDWYRYVLESGRSTITGQRCGSRKDVIAYATQCAEQLNTRGVTGQSIWSPRGRKPAAAQTAK